HRDLKPDNVLLGTDGQVKLADFGLARAVTTATTTKTLIGTVGYVAPELVTRTGADARTDLYTVGIMFYEMLTGAQPYTDDVPIQVAYRHVHDTVPPPSEVVNRLSPRLDALVLWATSKDPADRPADAAEFRLALAETRAEVTEAELDLGDPEVASGEHSPVLTASIDLSEEAPKEKRSRTDEIPYLEDEDDAEAADEEVTDSAERDSPGAGPAAAGAGVAAAAAGIGGVTSAVTSGTDDADGDEASDEDDDSSDTEDEDSSDDEGTADGEDPTGAAGAAGTAAAVDGEDSEDGECPDAGGGTSAGAAVAASAATGSAAASAEGSSSRRRLLTSIVAVAAVLALVAWLVIANLPEPTSI